jgi:hypothetical protein
MKRPVLFTSLLILVFAIGAPLVEAANRTDPGFIGKPAPMLKVGGDGCPPGAFVSDPMPWNDTGDTCAGFTNTVTTYAGTCTLPFPYGGEDVIYEMTLSAANTVDFSMDIAGSTGDLVLFVLSTCGDGSTCVANSQDSIGVGVGPELIPSASYPAGTYYVYVDSYYSAGSAGSCGAYSLTINGTLPAELVTFSAE